MSIRLISFLLVLFATSLSADPVENLLIQARVAESALDSSSALQLYRQADIARPNDAFILQKVAKQYSDLVPDQATDAGKKQYAELGLAYARRSFELEPMNAVYALSLAICHGHLAMVSDVRTKVDYSRLIKGEAERALELDPNYAWAHHILGRWHYEVASLGMTARFFARLLYGGIPPASTDEGITHLRRATELSPDELNHWIELGFAYAAGRRKAEARTSWERGLEMPIRSNHDKVSQQRAREALASNR